MPVRSLDRPSLRNRDQPSPPARTATVKGRARALISQLHVAVLHVRLPVQFAFGSRSSPAAGSMCPSPAPGEPGSSHHRRCCHDRWMCPCLLDRMPPRGRVAVAIAPSGELASRHAGVDPVAASLVARPSPPQLAAASRPMPVVNCIGICCYTSCSRGNRCSLRTVHQPAC